MVIQTVVITSEERRHLWEPWHRCWKQNAPEALSEVYLVTDRGKAEFEGVTLVDTGIQNWTQRVREGLEHVGDRFMILMDDFWLTPAAKEIPWEAVEEATFPILGLHPDSKYYTSEPAGIFRRFLPHSAYQASLQPVIWDKDLFLSLLIDNEGPWNFEIQGTKRLINRGITRHFLEVDWYVHAVKRGRLLPEARHLMGVA